jgi:hypothetical protein
MSIPKDNFEKATLAGDAFGCVPYFAIVIDGESIKGFIVSLSYLLELFPMGRSTCAWKMTPKYLEKYYKDVEIKIFEFQTSTKTWW